MVETTCAACDCKLDRNSFKVKISGKTVEVCCDDCARKLKEAHVSGSVSRKRQIMKRDVAVMLLGTVVIGSFVCGSIPARANSDAPVTTSTKNSGALVMSEKQSSLVHRSVQTASGLISYTEQGAGPVALFVHGVLLNGYLWRHQLDDLSNIRRCIAVDLLAHGDTEIAPDQDVSVTANAKMLKEFLDALNIDQVDLVGNDSGGGIAQIFAALYPRRVRSLALTDCDTHDNWPPEAFKPFLAMAAGGGLRGALETMLADKGVYRSPQALGPAYEHPEQLSDDSIERYLRPLVKTEQRTRDLQRFLAAFDNKHTVAIEAKLKRLQAPTLIVWGTDDVYFDLKWSHWLAENIPGTRRRVELQGARIFFPEERWQEFDKELRAHWQGGQETARQVAP
jgi:pimeloyl-ACP methyl ester carboxylesterase